MEFPNGSKICLTLVAFILLCPSMSWGDWSVLFFDDFDDGNYDGWSVINLLGNPAEAPDVVSSPEGYSLRGVGSGYYQAPGLNVHICQPLSISNSSELKIEMRAKSGTSWPNSAWVRLASGTDYYGFCDYGESNQYAQFGPYINGVKEWYHYSINANVWHDFAWSRDADGWWSLSMDGQEVWPNFHQDNQLTSFDKISIHLLRNQSEIEWVRISGVREPAEGWIVFSSVQDGDADIWAIRPDGTGLRQLVNMAGAQNYLGWSPDSTKIVYSSDSEAQLWVYDWFAGTNTKIYDAHDYEGQDLGSYGVYTPAWSPDGSKILFREDASYNNPHITVINADGTARADVPVQSGYVSFPRWSADGTAFVYDRRSSGHYHDLWIYDFTATGDIMNGVNHRLTQGASSYSTSKVRPDWMPSGNIVCTWGYNIAVIDPGQSPNWNGPISDPSNPNVTFLTNDGSYPSLIWYESPSWSPDLSQIVYDRYSGGYDLWVMDASGGNRYKLAAFPGHQEVPDWGNPTPLTHDECAYAIAVKANEPYNGSTRAATGTDTSSCSYNDTNDVWHSFTPKFNFDYTISLCGSAFDTTLSVFDDCNGTELACNDDTKPGICSPTLSTLQSQLIMPLVKDFTYFIRVAGYDGETGDYTLTVTGPVCTERPAMDFNDDCKVDFRDFAIFSQSWLECNLDPPELCWQ